MRTFALILATLTACSAQQRAETARAAAVFECELAALAPYVPDAIDTAELVIDVVTGRADLALSLARLGVPLAEIPGLLVSFNGCFASELAPLPPELEQTRIVAPPPAYGNKWL